ncbi:hypothetical protein CG471_21750 [Sphingobium sp. IP1]|uniref:hypothetical protein n=1 Tax=Sphingobium sp. IP1 TaxID=2021637 RepID=UPI000C089177|nr:hypothetical protein [Sphingobium sp. IP1]PHP17649.1 hypothetical protein CG471_21750 [Sphingobium sp. IP1]
MLLEELSELLSAGQMVRLAEIYAGTRLHIPQKATDSHALVQAIGRDGFLKIAQRFGTDTIKVPLFRELRVNHYRASGMSHAKIALRLGLTEQAVDRIVKRLREQGELLPIGSIEGVENLDVHCRCCRHYGADRMADAIAETPVVSA